MDGQDFDFSATLEEADKLLGRKKASPKTFSTSVEDILSRLESAVMEQESGGRQKVANPRTGALGLFQVLPSNIPAWTKKHLGRAMTPEEYANDANAQRTVFRKEFGSYLDRAFKKTDDPDTAVRMAAAGWYGGPMKMGRYDDSTKFRANEPSFREYTSSVLSRMKKQPNGASQNLDFSNTLAEADRILGGAEFDTTLNEANAVLNPQTPQTVEPQMKFDKQGNQVAALGGLDQTTAPVETPQPVTSPVTTGIEDANKRLADYRDNEINYRGYLDAIGGQDTIENRSNFDALKQKGELNPARSQSQPLQTPVTARQTPVQRPGQQTQPVNQPVQPSPTGGKERSILLSGKHPNQTYKEYFDDEMTRLALENIDGATEEDVRQAIANTPTTLNGRNWDNNLERAYADLAKKKADSAVILELAPGFFDAVKKASAYRQAKQATIKSNVQHAYITGSQNVLSKDDFDALKAEGVYFSQEEIDQMTEARRQRDIEYNQSVEQLTASGIPLGQARLQTQFQQGRITAEQYDQKLKEEQEAERIYGTIASEIDRNSQGSKELALPNDGRVSGGLAVSQNMGQRTLTGQSYIQDLLSQFDTLADAKKADDERKTAWARIGTRFLSQPMLTTAEATVRPIAAGVAEVFPQLLNFIGGIADITNAGLLSNNAQQQFADIVQGMSRDIKQQIRNDMTDPDMEQFAMLSSLPKAFGGIAVQSALAYAGLPGLATALGAVQGMDEQLDALNAAGDTSKFDKALVMLSSAIFAIPDYFIFKGLGKESKVLFSESLTNSMMQSLVKRFGERKATELMGRVVGMGLRAMEVGAEQTWTGFKEGSQESLEKFGNDLVAKALYDPNRKVAVYNPDDFWGGFLLGPLAGAVEIAAEIRGNSKPELHTLGEILSDPALRNRISADLQRKMDRVRKLAEQGATEGERAAAREALARLEKAAKERGFNVKPSKATVAENATVSTPAETPVQDETVKPQPAQLNPQEPRPAVWKNKDVDQPISVTGEVDVNGEKFYTIEGSKTGIPANEVTFEQPVQENQSALPNETKTPVSEPSAPVDETANVSQKQVVAPVQETVETPSVETKPTPDTNVAQTPETPSAVKETPAITPAENVQAETVKTPVEQKPLETKIPEGGIPETLPQEKVKGLNVTPKEKTATTATSVMPSWGDHRRINNAIPRSGPQTNEQMSAAIRQTSAEQIAERLRPLLAGKTEFGKRLPELIYEWANTHGIDLEKYGTTLPSSRIDADALSNAIIKNQPFPEVFRQYDEDAAFNQQAEQRKIEERQGKRNTVKEKVKGLTVTPKGETLKSVSSNLPEIWRMPVNGKEYADVPYAKAVEAAFGFNPDTLTSITPDKLNVKWKEDFANAKHQQETSGLSKTEWAKSVNLSEPIQLSFKNGKFFIEDGHHRYHAAKILGVPLKVDEVKVEDKAHKFAVEQALKAGKSVPAEVLADYPDLAKKYAETPLKSVSPQTAPQVITRENADTATTVIGKDAGRVVKALVGLSPQTSVQIHPTEASYLKAVEQSGGVPTQAQGTSGFYYDDGKTIHLNAEKVRDNTVFHEGVHAIVATAFNRDPRLLRKYAQELKKILPTKDQAKYLAFANRYKGSDIQNEELVAEVLGDIANGKLELPRSTVQKLVDWAKSILKRLGFNTDNLTISSKDDFASFARKVSTAMREGKALTSAESAQKQKGVRYQDDVLKSVSSVEDWDSVAFEKELDGIELTRDKDGKILAPNGKVSNIQNERLAKIVRTNAFEQWDNGEVLRDENGDPRIFYHGSPQGDFEVFRPEQYFSPDPNYASRYTSGNGVAISGGIKTETSPAMFAVFLKAGRLFDPRTVRDKKIWDNQFFRKFGNGTPLMESGLPDWVEGRDLAEFLQDEINPPYDGMLIDEGGDEAGKRPPSVVVFSPTQIKSIFNRGSFSPSEDSILKSVSSPQAEKNLIVAHNLTESNLTFSDRMGGIAMPSLAITKPEVGFSGFGDITLIGPPSMAEPSRQNPVTDADMYSPRYPSQMIFTDARKIEAEWQPVLDAYDKFYPTRNSWSDEPSSALGMREALKDDGLEAVRRSKPFQVYAMAQEGIITKPLTSDDLYRLSSEHSQLIDAAAQDFVEQLDPEYKFFKGYTNLGNRRYGAYDLATVLKEMKSQMREGEGFNYGAGSVRAAAATKFKSLKEIQKNRDRIVTGDALESVKDEAQKELGTLAERYAPFYKYDSTRFGYYGTFSEAVMEGLRSRNMRRTFEEYGFENVDDWTPLNDYLTKLRNLPTEYFEAKPQRIVQLQEFTAAVVPSDISDRARKMLERRGLDVIEYKRGDTQSRREAVQQAAQANNLLFKKRTEESTNILNNYLPYEKRTNVVVENIESKFNENGELEVNEYGAETIRRVLADINDDINELPFDAVTFSPANARQIADAMKAAIPEMSAAGYNTKPVRELAKQLTQLSKATAPGVVYLYDDALPEERVHVEDLTLGRTDAEATKALKASPLWNAAQQGNFAQEYGGQSEQNQISEIAAKLATGQESKYGFDRIDNFEEEKEKFLRDWSDGIVRKNEAIIKQMGAEAFLAQFPTVGKYGQVKTGNAEGTGSVGAETGVETGNGETGVAQTGQTEGQGTQGDTEAEAQPEADRRLSDDGRIKKRQFAVSMAEQLFDIGDVEYEAQTEKGWSEKALGKVERLGAEKALAEYRKMPANDSAGNKTALGVALAIDYYQKGEFDQLTKFGKELTENIGNAAQELRAAALLSRLSPVFAETYAERIVQRKHKREATVEEKRTARLLAEKLNDLSNQAAMMQSALDDKEAWGKELEQKASELEQLLKDEKNRNRSLKASLTRAKNIAAGYTARPTKTTAQNKALRKKIESEKQSLIDTIRKSLPNFVLKAVSRSNIEVTDYKTWKRQTVTLRGIAGEIGSTNQRTGMLGRGLYTAPLSNKAMVKEYGVPHFVVNGRPLNPKRFSTLNEWQIWQQNTLIAPYGRLSKFNESTTIEDAVQALGYDGIEIIGREMVNFTPRNVRYFRTEDELKRYFDTMSPATDSTILKSVSSRLDPAVHDAFVKLSAAKMIDEFSKTLIDSNGQKTNAPFTVTDFDNWLNGLADNTLSPDERAAIHADAFEMIRPQRQALVNLDAVARMKNRSEHARAAENVLPNQQKEALKDREAYRTDKFAKAMIQTAKEMGASQEDVFMAFGVRELGDKRALEAEFKAQYPDGKFNEALLNGERIYKETKDRIEKLRQGTKAGKSLTDKELFEIRHADSLKRSQAHTARRELERYYRELEKNKAEKAVDHAFNATGLPKTLMSTGEISFVLRQGFIPMLMFSKEWGQGLKGVKAGMSNEDNRLVYEQTLRDDPDFKLAEHYGVVFNQIGSRATVDEHFPAQFIEQVAKADTKDRNVFAKGAIKAARAQQRFEHAYTLPGDAMRLGLFKNFARIAEQANLTPAQLEKAYKYAAYMANISVGKGSIAKVFGQNGYFTQFLAAIGFSPSLLLSRIEAGFNYSPLGIAVAAHYGGKGMAFHVAKKSARMYGTLAAVGLLLQGLVSMLWGGDDDDKEPWSNIINPDSPYFMKLRLPNGMKVDLTANMSDWGKLFLPNFMASGYHAMQQALGNDPAGYRKASDVWKGDYDRLASGRYWQGKLSPSASAAVEIYQGKDFLGRPVTPWGIITSRTLPLTYQQAYEGFFYDPADQFMKEPVTVERALKRWQSLMDMSPSEIASRAGNAALTFGMSGVGAGLTQYERFDQTPAEKKAFEIYQDNGVLKSRKTPEEQRIRTGLRNLFRYMDEMERRGENVAQIQNTIEKYARRYKVSVMELKDLEDQALSGVFAFTTKQMTVDQVKSLMDYANDKEKKELKEILAKKLLNQAKKKISELKKAGK